MNLRSKKLEEEEIKKLVDLNPGEEIFAIIQLGLRLVYLDELDERYHNVDDLPKNFFTLEKNMIKFIDTHVFTNERYLQIGVNFLQISSKYQYISHLKINNIILSIERKELVSLKFDLETSNLTIFLNDFLRIECFSYENYEKIRSILINKWNFSENMIQALEEEFIIKNKKQFYIISCIELVIEILLLSGNILGYIHKTHPIFQTILLSMMIATSGSIILWLLTAKRKSMFYYGNWQILIIFSVYPVFGIFFSLYSI